MRIAIDAPTKRSLSPTEKKVYNLLQEGNTPKEVAKITRLPYGTENTFYFDPTIPTIKNIITAIREKAGKYPSQAKIRRRLKCQRAQKYPLKRLPK